MASDRHEFPRLATRADFVFSKYRRHFAGKNRATRDLGLMGEMISDLNQIRDDMATHLAKNKVPLGENDLELVKSNLELYEREQAEINNAQTSGPPEQQAETLSQSANVQFESYRGHFAKESRASRRPELLERILGRLKIIHDRMVALKEGGFDAEFHAKNIGIVAENMARYTRELGEIKRVRRDFGAKGLIPHLGDAANAIFALYREGFAGKARSAVDLDRLVILCDKLDEVRRQMDDVGAVVDDEKNEKNYHIVVGQLRMFEKEFAAINESRKK